MQAQKEFCNATLGSCIQFIFWNTQVGKKNEYVYTTYIIVTIQIPVFT